MVVRLFIVLAIVLSLASFANAERQPRAVEVVVSTDLQADAVLAEKSKLPLLLMFSMQGCTYCEIVEEDFLRPMLISGDYADKVIIRKLMMDSFNQVKDFNGEQIDVDDLADRYNASLTPTVVFVNSKGSVVAETLVGLTTPDFYGGDLDDQIDVALRQIRTTRVAQSPSSAGIGH